MMPPRIGEQIPHIPNIQFVSEIASDSI